MEVETLNAMMNELLRRVTKEKDRGLKTLREVEKWISTAEDIDSKASSLLDESISQCHDLSKYDDCSKISESTHHYNEMVCMTLEEVKEVRSKGVFKELVERAPLSRFKKMLPLQPIHSREMLLEEVWKCLAENECRTLGLYGMAGVGKTTILTRIKNKYIEDGHVSTILVLFVVVESDEVEGIQVAIMERLGMYVGLKDQEEKAFAIFRILKVKRFVLFLDGIQRKVDLEEIGVPLPSKENGCKIVFTTRSQETCKSMRVDTEVEVKCLSPEEAWDVFQEVVGETTLKSHPDIPQLARIVAGKCGGLPITLSLIGETMSRKRTVREWHHAIHVLVSSTTGMDAELLPMLKFSYDNLPGANIRSCFLYCALFPKNCDISKQDLVDSWIAEGLIEEEEDREIAEIQGYERMGDLVRMRLLMNNESGYGVKMHGMVREMALWIASDIGREKENFVVVGGVGIHQMPEVNDWRIVRRMSVTSNQIENISDSPDCPDLTTLFLQENNLKWVSGDFFRWMTSLVVLNLSRNRELSELPEEVSSLVSLRLLNLSWTWIKRLPLGLKELKRLIHLDLDETPFLREIDVIGYLLNLQVLRLFRSMDLSLREYIQLPKSLKDLSLTVIEVDVLKDILSNHRLASCIGRLHLKGITITDNGVLLLNPMLNLRELDIVMCNIPEVTINWRSTIQRETVHYGNIEKIPHLQNIRAVNLYRCTGVRDLTWLLLAPHLGNLKLHECPQMEQIINKEKATADMSEQPFQNLTRLSLDSLPKLESIYWNPLPFPVLDYLHIRGCPKLRRHPFNSNYDREWIKGVESEKKAQKQHISLFDDRDFPKKIAEYQKMDALALASESHPVENISMVGTSEFGKSTIADFDDWVFPDIDGLASESHPIESIVPAETSRSGKSITENSIAGERVFQSGTDATVELTQTHRALTPDATIIDTPVRTAMQPQVFLHFGGSELRKGFIGFLEPAMREANINVFIDDQKLKGRVLADLLVRIEGSKVALAIFSKDYPNSEWCLDELVKIKECRDQGSLKVIPIFYNLEPSVVRYLQGSFGDNFRNLIRKYQHGSVKAQQWEEALVSITETTGMILPEGSDRSGEEFINSIVIEVKKLLANIPIVTYQSRGIFFVPARRLDITYSKNPKIWKWSSIYDAESEADEVATLIKVYWLHIAGKFHTRKLTPGTTYEVVFMVNLDDTAYGWEEPVTLQLMLNYHNGSQTVQDVRLKLDHYIGDNWVDIRVGEFKAPPKSAPAKVFFSLHQHMDTYRKNGLMVKGVAIRPMATDQVII